MIAAHRYKNHPPAQSSGRWKTMNTHHKSKKRMYLYFSLSTETRPSSIMSSISSIGMPPNSTSPLSVSTARKNLVQYTMRATPVSEMTLQVTTLKYKFSNCT